MVCVCYQMAKKKIVFQAIEGVLKGAGSTEVPTSANGMFQCEHNMGCVWSHNSIVVSALTPSHKK